MRRVAAAFGVSRSALVDATARLSQATEDGQPKAAAVEPAVKPEAVVEPVAVVDLTTRPCWSGFGPS